MTRVNLLPVEVLLDQHLMAEYRELPMVMASLRRSLASPRFSLAKLPLVYTLGPGHVSFFYQRHAFLLQRWLSLIAELEYRGFKIDPVQRRVSFKVFRAVTNQPYVPTPVDVRVNAVRIFDRYMDKPEWYKLHGRPVKPLVYRAMVRAALRKPR